MQSGFLGSLDLTRIFASLVVLFVSLPVHSFAKAYAAKKLGDPSAEQYGRLTLNPFAHIDPWGAIALVLFRFGWSKPLPIESRNLKNPKRDLGIIAAVGTLAYFLMGLVFTFPTMLLYRQLMIAVTAVPNSPAANLETLSMFYELFFTIAVVNVQLGVINLLPFPPFDGGNILAALLPTKIAVPFYRFFIRHQGVITVALLVLLYVGVLSIPLGWLSSKILLFFQYLVGFIVR